MEQRLGMGARSVEDGETPEPRADKAHYVPNLCYNLLDGGQVSDALQEEVEGVGGAAGGEDVREPVWQGGGGRRGKVLGGFWEHTHAEFFLGVDFLGFLGFFG